MEKIIGELISRKIKAQEEIESIDMVLIPYQNQCEHEFRLDSVDGKRKYWSCNNCGLTNITFE